MKMLKFAPFIATSLMALASCGSSKSSNPQPTAVTKDVRVLITSNAVGNALLHAGDGAGIFGAQSTIDYTDGMGSLQTEFSNYNDSDPNFKSTTNTYPGMKSGEKLTITLSVTRTQISAPTELKAEVFVGTATTAAKTIVLNSSTPRTGSNLTVTDSFSI